MIRMFGNFFACENDAAGYFKILIGQKFLFQYLHTGFQLYLLATNMLSRMNDNFTLLRINWPCFAILKTKNCIK